MSCLASKSYISVNCVLLFLFFYEGVFEILRVGEKDTIHGKSKHVCLNVKLQSVIDWYNTFSIFFKQQLYCMPFNQNNISGIQINL